MHFLRKLALFSLGGGAYVGLELLVNRDHHVWDYRSLPGNFKGKICLPFTALWYPLSGIAMGLYDWADRTL